MRTNEFTPCQVNEGNWLLGDGMLGGRWDNRLLSRLTQAPTQGILRPQLLELYLTSTFHQLTSTRGVTQKTFYVATFLNIWRLFLGSPQCIRKWCGSVAVTVTTEFYWFICLIIVLMHMWITVNYWFKTVALVTSHIMLPVIQQQTHPLISGSEHVT
jgi:hypothetical protein